MPVSKCFVPGCNTGYKSCLEKYSLFTPPADPVLLQKWQRSIPRGDRVLSRKDKVCERHFDSTLVDREYVINVAGHSTIIPRGKPILCTDAVPHLFPNLAGYLSKPKLANRKRRCVTLTTSETVRKRTKKSQAAEPDHASQPVVEISCDADISFVDLREASKSVCPKTWCMLFEEKCMSFCKLGMIKCQGMVIYSVSITDAMEVTVFYMGNVANLQHPSHIVRLNQLINLFSLLDSLHECPGNPDDELQKAISSSRVGIHDSHTWRHINCARLTERDRCLPCRKFRRVLQTAAAHKHKYVHRKICKRAERLRTVDRLRRRVDVLRAVSLRLKKSLSNATNSSLDKLLEPLSPNQQLAVKHCMRQVQAKSARGMRYDHRWILACILLRIKSPKAYEHLRDHSFLALPTRRTLGQYIDVVNAETGIAEDVIKLISQRVNSAAERRGVLMFDEVKLREGIRFNSKLMEFDGLVDFSEFQDTKNQNIPADTGLVFMYRPVMGQWVQSVGMFLSRGATPASVLSKILLKLILALESHDLWVCIHYKFIY